MKNLLKGLFLTLILSSAWQSILSQKEVRNSKGQVIYKIDKDGTLRQSNGKIIGRTDDGQIRDVQHKVIIKTEGSAIKTPQGKPLGTVTPSTIYDSKNRPIATKDENTIRIRNRTKIEVK